MYIKGSWVVYCDMSVFPVKFTVVRKVNAGKSLLDEDNCEYWDKYLWYSSISDASTLADQLNKFEENSVSVPVSFLENAGGATKEENAMNTDKILIAPTRKCAVKMAWKKTSEERPAQFHLWERYSCVVEDSPFVGGAPGGQFSQVYGIVEFEDGTIGRYDPTLIRFDKEVVAK